MSRFERSVVIIHDLFLIPQERATTYEKLMRYPDQDVAICQFIRGIAVQSRNCMIELRRHIDMDCGDPADRVEVKGEIYQEWPGIKYFLPDSSPAEVFSYCESNENETVRAYQKAISSPEICEEFRNLLRVQLKTIRNSFKLLNECKEKPMAPASALVDERMPFAFSRSAVTGKTLA